MITTEIRRETGRVYDGPQVLVITPVDGGGWDFMDESRCGIAGHVPWPNTYSMSVHNLSELDIFNHVLYCYDHGAFVNK